MLRLHRVRWPENRADFVDAWHWMREQPELYNFEAGYDSFGDFTEPPLERIEFALRRDGELIGFAYLIYKGTKCCQFCLITPPGPRVRSLLALLQCLEREYFETLGFTYVFAVCPDDPRYDRPRRLSLMFGLLPMKESPHVFEYTHFDYEQRTKGA